MCYTNRQHSSNGKLWSCLRASVDLESWTWENGWHTHTHHSTAALSLLHSNKHTHEAYAWLAIIRLLTHLSWPLMNQFYSQPQFPDATSVFLSPHAIPIPNALSGVFINSRRSRAHYHTYLHTHTHIRSGTNTHARNKLQSNTHANTDTVARAHWST